MPKPIWGPSPEIVSNEKLNAMVEYSEELAAVTPLFQQDAETTTGLTFGYAAGRVRDGATVTEVVAGTVALAASDVSYIEVDPETGTVSDNIVGFTPGQIPLYEVTTDTDSITDVADRRTWLANDNDNKMDKVTGLPVTTTPNTHWKAGSSVEDFDDQGDGAVAGEGYRGGHLNQLEARGGSDADFLSIDRIDGNDNGDGGIALRFVGSTGAPVNGWYLLDDRIEQRQPLSLHHTALQTPAAGQSMLGFNASGVLSIKDSSGAETAVGSGGGATDEMAIYRSAWLYG